jgi:hypothetical protein
MADFGDAVDPAIADAVAEAEGKKPISAPAAEELEIPEVPAIPELSPTEKGDIGTHPAEAESGNGVAAQAADQDTPS